MIRKNLNRVFLTTCLLTGLFAGTAFAATKTISSVTIRVGTDITAGDLLEENITIYDNTTDKQEGTYAGTNSTKYYIRDAEWVTDTDEPMEIGQEPKLRLYLFTEDDEYAFRGSYNSSNVKIKGGTFSTAKRSNGELEVVVRLNGIEGQYEAPMDASWRESGMGRAIWNQDYDRDDEMYDIAYSGYYDVKLYRGGSLVKTLEAYKGTSYNFYPYMTKAGTYYYKVRSVPYTESEKKYGEKSEWIDSDEIYIDKEDVSDGSGQVDGNGISTGVTSQVGWIQSGNTWYYRYPDGSYQKNSWLKVNGIWYLFDATGKMTTGWQNKDGLTYYLQDNGAMYSGWIKWGNYWYYMNRVGDSGVEGAMRTGWLTADNKTYYLRSDGSMAEGWTQVDGNWYYFYPGYGYKATNTVIDTFYVDANGIWRR